MDRPEDRARERIDALLAQAGWEVSDPREANIHAARGVAIRNFPLNAPSPRARGEGGGEGRLFADYLLYVDGKAVGVIEAKKEGATLTGIVRNLCAHHSRLWNRRFVFTPILPKRPAGLSAYFNPGAPRNLYNTLVLARYELAIISPGSLWEERMITLLREHSTVEPKAIGFPEKWQDMDI